MSSQQSVGDRVQAYVDTSSLLPLITQPLMSPRSAPDAKQGSFSSIVFRLDRDGRYLFINQAIRLYTSLTPEQCLGKTTRDMGFSAELIVDFEAHVRSAIETGLETTFEFSALCEAGKRELRTRLIPETDSEGIVISVLGFTEDATTQKKIQVELDERQNQLRHALTAAGMYAFAWDTSTDVVERFPDPNFFADLEHGGSGQNYLDLVHPDDRQALIECEKKAKETGSVYESEHRLRRRDGTYMWIYDRARFERATPEAAPKLVGITWDISCRKLVMGRLAQSEASFRQLADAMPQIVWTANAEGKIDYVNRRYTEHTGIPDTSEFVPHWLAGVHPGDLSHCAESAERARQAGEGITCEIRIRDDKGQYRWFLNRVVPLKGPKGDIIKWYGTATDIDQQKKMTEELKERKMEALQALAQLDTLLELSPVGFAFLDCQLKFTRINRALSALRRSSPEDHLGKGLDSLGTQMADSIEPLCRRILETGMGIHDVELSTGRSPAEQRHWLGNFYPVKSPDGENLGIGAAVIEITERKRAERHLKLLAESLSASNDELSRFALIASHDLKEPLRTIATYSQVLAKNYQSKLDAQATLIIDQIVDGVKRMYGFIDALLGYSQLGARPIDKSRFNARESVEDAKKSLSTSLNESGAKVDVGHLPEVTANRTQLNQLFQNLLGNAVKYRSDRPLLIRITARELSEYWEFAIADNGIGVPREHFERIFHLFERLAAGPSTDGAGIGLNVCRKIVEGHEGKLWLDSEVGHGSIFYFTLRK